MEKKLFATEEQTKKWFKKLGKKIALVANFFYFCTNFLFLLSGKIIQKENKFY